MSKLILHVGTHKTATTSVQDLLFANRQLLAKNNIIYPNIGPSTGHHSLVTDWIKLPPKYHSKHSATNEWKSLAKKYSHTDKTVIISSEEFSRGNPNQRVNLQEIRELCKEFDSVKVICFLRNQVSFLQSVYLQVAKTTAPPMWPAFFNQAINSHMATGVYLDYNKLYAFLLTGFQPEEISFCSYDQNCREPNGIVREILKAAGHGDITETLVNLPKNSNISPDAITYWAASQLIGRKEAPPHLISDVNEIVKIQFGQGVKTSVYSTAENQKMIDVFTPLNEKLAKDRAVFGEIVDLSLLHSNQNTIYRDKVDQKFWIKLARKFYENG